MHGGGVTVLFTTPEPTLAALRTARRLTREHGAPVRLVVMLPVPYPLPLVEPARAAGIHGAADPPARVASLGGNEG